jgi:hypothetical protein
MIVHFGSVNVIRDGLHRQPQLAQIIERYMEYHVAVMKVGGILTTATERD